MATTAHAHWSSRWAFIMAAVGSAVGLGNIWKFPYEAGDGGGGAFVIFYLLFVFLIGLPVLIAELSLGRRGQQSPINTMKTIAKAEKQSPLWALLGWSGVIGGFLIISFYSVVGGWVLAYIIKAFQGFQGYDAVQSANSFGAYISDPVQPILSHMAFMGITLFIVARGVQGGLEKAVSFLMPALFALLVGMVLYSAFTADFKSALNFLFNPDFGRLFFDTTLDPASGVATKHFTVSRVVEAMGLAFFSLSLAMGSIMTYGSYLDKNTNIPRAAITIASADSAVALLAGLAIFPIVFAYGLEPGQGGGLVFITLPIAFGQMGLGVVVGTAFFFLLAVAAITSSISLLEPTVSYIEEKTGASRIKISLLMGGAAFLFGTLSSWGQSGNLLGDVQIFGLDIMGVKDYLTANIMMPLGGMFIALFTGWFISRKSMMEELAISDGAFKLWYFLVRFVCPVAIGLVFISLIFNL